MKALHKNYPGNPTPAWWSLVTPYPPAGEVGGKPCSISAHRLFYMLCLGWLRYSSPGIQERRVLLGDFPAWRTVYTYFCTWPLDGTWKRIRRYLRQ